MSAHLFLFRSGFWAGEGIISFSMSEDKMPFKVTWSVEESVRGEIQCTQLLDVEGIPETMRNEFILKPSAEHFAISLSNEFVGQVIGKGLSAEKTIAWEFRNPSQQFQGYEIYEKTEDPTCYKMRAEFTSGDGLMTHVRGQIRLVPLG